MQWLEIIEKGTSTLRKILISNEQCKSVTNSSDKKTPLEIAV